jgi:carboxyl-terminal processing protease
MPRIRSPRPRTIAIATLALVPLLAGGFAVQSRSSSDGARVFDQVLSLVNDRFVDTLGAATLYEKAAQGLVRELNDPYSELLTPKRDSEFSRRTGGRYGGIGMTIEDVGGSVIVSKVFPHTPAEEAGVAAGDRIVQIEAAQTTGWPLAQVSDSLIGTPGTKVSVRFSRTGVTDPIALRFTRAIIHVPAVPFSIMLDGKIAYIPLQQFNEDASEDMEASLGRLVRTGGAKGIVLDLRDDPGGILDQALSVSNMFLHEGQQLVSVRGRNTPPQIYTAREHPLIPDVPLIVLVNGGSASASEIVAGALQDHDRALIVGTTSFGKGLVQSLFPLDGGYALKMTTAKWYTPSGRSIQKERKLLADGEFIEVHPDSLETDSARKARPAFKSDAGRIVYGGGAITPDVVVKLDSLTTQQQAFNKLIAPKLQPVLQELAKLALDIKPSVKSPSFTVQPAWRDDFYNRLKRAGVAIDRPQYDSLGGYVDRVIAGRVAETVYGDSVEKRRNLDVDLQLKKAVDLLEHSQSQKDLFVEAQQMAEAMPATRPK